MLCGALQGGAEARAVLDALDDADDDLGVGVVSQPFEIIGGVDDGFVAARDDILKPMPRLVASSMKAFTSPPLCDTSEMPSV